MSTMPDDIRSTDATRARELLAQAIGVETMCDRSGSAPSMQVRLVMPDGSRSEIVLCGLDMNVHVPSDAAPGHGAVTFWLTDGTAVTWSEPAPRYAARAARPVLPATA